jgi:hypothetical protein
MPSRLATAFRKKHDLHPVFNFEDSFSRFFDLEFGGGRAVPRPLLPP